MKIAVFGSSLVSSYWNGVATYYRGLIRALHVLGHQVTFFEPDAFERQQHRDIDDPAWARVVVYENSLDGLSRAVETAYGCDALVKTSDIGVFDRELEAAVLGGPPGALAVFWDVDDAATLGRLASNPHDPFHGLLPRYDAVFTHGGGEPVRRGYLTAGARFCEPIYNALDPETHFPVRPDPRFLCDLGLLANRIPDRECRVDEFFFGAAKALRDRAFILGGSGWTDKLMPPNVRYAGHVYTADYNAFNSTPLAVLNVSRGGTAHHGYSPATRVFEAAGAGACLITDAWEGIEQFYEPGREILVAGDCDDVTEWLTRLNRPGALAMGAAARERTLTYHTYARRAAQVSAVLEGRAVAA